MKRLLLKRLLLLIPLLLALACPAYAGKILGPDFIGAGGSDIALQWDLTDSIVPEIGVDKTATFTRSTTSWYEAGSTWTQAAVDEAVFETDGFRFEPQRTNLVENYNVIGADQNSSELLTNGDASSQGSVDSSAAPLDGWTNRGTHNATNKITIASNQFRLISDGTYVGFAQSMTKGKVYTYSIDIVTETDASLALNVPAGVDISLAGVGTKTGTFVATAIIFEIKRASGAGTVDVTFDNVSLIEIGGTDITDDSFVSGLGTGAQATAAANPIPGMTVSGDAAATLTVYDGSGISNISNFVNLIGSDYKIYELDNSAGGAGVGVLIEVGTLSDTKTYTGTIYGYADSDDNANVIRFGDGSDGTTKIPQGTELALVELTSTMTADRSNLVIIANAGSKVYFSLNGTEEGNAVTSPIITQGAATTRTADDLRLPVADGTNFRQAQGMLFADVVLGADGVDMAAGDSRIINFADGARLTVQNAGTKFYNYDGTTFIDSQISALLSDTTYKVYTRWGAGTGNFQTGYNGSSGTAGDYDGAFNVVGTDILFGTSTTERFWIKNIRVLNIDRGQTYAESETN